MREYRTETNEVGAEVPKSIEWVFRESWISRRVLDGLSDRNRADEIGVTKALRTHMVGNQSE
jgi:hypothetical protein